MYILFGAFLYAAKFPLSTCAPMQWPSRIKLLQLREFFELRRAAFREGGPSAFEKKGAVENLFLGAENNFH